MKGKLIIIDGNDSSGKATQTEKLFQRLVAMKQPVKKVEFPDYSSPSSSLVKMYLNGSFGENPDDVSPYVASAFYAVDRFASWRTNWGSFYEAGGIILADRYVTSNMIHQAAKIANEEQRQAYLNWLWDLEFIKFSLPVPDCVLFLDMPPAYSTKLMAGRRLKSGENTDIHERDSDYLAHCYDHSQQLVKQYGWQRISCISEEAVRSVEEIHEELYLQIKPFLV